MLNFFLNFGPLIYFGLVAFIMGAMAASFLNVVVARLVFEKSVMWPGSRCGHCFQPIRFFPDNIPIFSYLFLRGRCRTCKSQFSIQYFLVELGMALAFVAVLVVEVIHDINGIPGLKNAGQDLNFRFVTATNLPYFTFFLHRAILLWLLTAAALCDLKDAGGDHVIPFSIPLTGTIIGLIFAVCCPWPWPSTWAQAQPVLRFGQANWWLVLPNDIEKTGLYLWPVWGPPPSWAPPGSWQLGLLTGLTGAAAGTFLLRAFRFLAKQGLKRDPMGLGDADLMMMVGAFLGWQPVVIAFFLGGLISLILNLPSALLNWRKPIPFGPGLALGTVVTWLSWRFIAPKAQAIFFQKWFIFGLFGLCGGATFFLMFLFGAFQGRGKPAEEKQS